MGLISFPTQIAVILCTFTILVLFHWYLQYRCKSKWITSIPQKSICLFNASIFACVCGFGGWYVWLNPSDEQLIHPLHGTNILQEYICLIGVGYFIYDILIVIFIDPTLTYLIHAILGMLFGYLGGVIPLASHSGSFVMAYEISTPFKNMRYLMIKWGYSKSILFRLTEIAFILSFFYLRLVVGLKAMYDVTDGFLIEINSLHAQLINAENAHLTDTKFRLYGTYFLLYGGWANVLLNVYWSYAIFKAIVMFGRHKGDYTPNDENEIVYDTQLTNMCGVDGDIDNSTASLITEGDCLYFGELYFRNAPFKADNAENSEEKNDVHIDVYNTAMAKTYYKCEFGAILMSLNHNHASKKWMKFLSGWDRNSHFGDSKKSLLYSVKNLLHFYSNISLTPNTISNEYHTEPLKKVKYGNVYLLTLLKNFGFGFNPVSVYYCMDETNTKLSCVLLEMINIPWSKRHIYVLPIEQFSKDQQGQSGQMKNINFMKICPFSPNDFTHFNGKPNGYSVTVNAPSDILQIYGHVFSFFNHQNDHKNDQNPPKLVHQHSWGTSSCIIPKTNDDGKQTETFPVIEFGLNKCKRAELNNMNLAYLLVWYPFTSFVLRFQLYLFIIMNWLKSVKWHSNNKSNSSYSMHKKRLNYVELTAEIIKVVIGGFCFLFKTIWNVIGQCWERMTG